MFPFNIVLLIILSSTAIAADVQNEGMSSGFYKFGVDLYQQCSQFESGNLVISPFSVGTSLTLLSQAANGTTYEQLRKHLYLNGEKSIVADQFRKYIELIKRSAGQSELMITNQIYVEERVQLNQNFQKVATDEFDAGIESVDFVNKNDTLQLINNFIEEKTKGKIKQIIDDEMLTADTRFVLVNAIYLKSIWLQPFPQRKRDGQFYDMIEKFYISETETVEAKFMKMSKEVWIAELHELDIAALRLDYLKSNYSFIIILPNKRTGLSTLEAQLQKINLSKIVEQMKFITYRVEIPKFKVKTKFRLNEILKNMGINEMFEPWANLSGLLNTREPLFVSQVVHQATIEINEKLIEAAAATGSASRALSGTGVFRAEHPFMYFVWDRETSTTIFSGCIKNFPTNATSKQ
ncbi:serine protease inhibitor 42Dd-like [Sitodiplosis mosellana]|uniref:serine protease inhibitor 42Dd-like n=1 Tax=Sitodiplosis mosellana TaxID=263140 RepID=UPI002444B64C|nr:serine protease inhibitor 42Dd-like [Sitodiplosis mosellana]